jgi:DNA-binding PadR family transcriptional regulator
MPKAGALSPQSIAVIAALAASPSAWQHGYELAKQTALQSGTLYPILIRLAERGLVEARWEEEQPRGRPRRHLYRLTAAGRATAAASAAETRTMARRRPSGSIAVEGAS